jgi:hypothetical protein
MGPACYQCVRAVAWRVRTFAASLCGRSVHIRLESAHMPYMGADKVQAWAMRRI